MRDTADALDYMSEQHSLQHLDVKPENLLLVGGRIKVADFGLVKDMEETSASMMGGLTPIYAPPEVFDGRPSRRSDQYSLAIVYQEMLTGVLPFPGRTAAQLAAQHLNAKPRLDPLPENDQAVIGRALSKKPNERFETCRELVDALVEAGRRAPGESHPDPEPGVGVTNFMTSTRLPGQMLADLDTINGAVQQIVADGGQPAPTITGVPRGARFTQSRSARTTGGADLVAGSAQHAPELEALQQSPPLVDVPPPDFDPT